MPNTNAYYNPNIVSKHVADNRHRDLVGGLWDEMGLLQFSYLKENGLQPEDHFLDIGCGCLRGGIHFINFLNAGGYHGLDLSEELLEVGYSVELAAAGLQDKQPRTQLKCISDFETGTFGQTFDVALALSVFTHLPQNHIRLCLARLAANMRPGGLFYATVFISPEDHDWAQSYDHTPGGIRTYPHQDPFHYQAADVAAFCRGLPWSLERLENWNHPRNQIMAVFRRKDSRP